MKDLIPWKKKTEGMTPVRGSGDQMQTLQRRMNDLFDDFFEDFGDVFGSRHFPLLRQNEQWLAESPSFEVSETDEAFRVKAELPGLEEKDIEVNLEGDVLTIRGEKKREQEEKHRNYHVSEMSYGEFHRAFRLPEGVDREKAKAQFKKGVLTLTLPKTEQVKTQRKRIEIATEA